MNNKNRKKKRIIFILAGILILAAYAAGAFILLHSGAEKQPTKDVRNYNEDSSLILLTGKNYSLEKEQEDIYMEQKKAADQQSKPPEKKETKTVKSIVKQKTDESGNGIGTEDGAGKGKGQKGKPMEEPETEPQTEPETEPQTEPETEPPTQPETETDPVVQDKTPIIETNIGSEAYGSNVAFTVRGTDYKGRTIDSYNYYVTLGGIQLYSSGTDGNGFVTYRANGQSPGVYQVAISVKDSEGNLASQTYTITVAAEADVPIDAWVTLTVEARSVGAFVGGSEVWSTTEQIYKDESAAHFVQRVLTQYGLTPAMDAVSGYLSRISGISAGAANVPEPLKPFVEEKYGESLYGVSVPGALGEKDYTPDSGWIYLYNGVYMGTGLSTITLVDGDGIHIGFTLNLGAEYNGTWSYYGAW